MAGVVFGASGVPLESLSAIRAVQGNVGAVLDLHFVWQVWYLVHLDLFFGD